MADAVAAAFSAPADAPPMTPSSVAASHSASPDDFSAWADTNGPATTPLDAAADYLRDRPARVLPLYVLAMAPHAVLSVMLIDAMFAGWRSRAATLCVGLTIATVWRWAVLARLQADVQRDLRGLRADRFWSRLPAILWTRLAANVALTWGGVLVLPSFYGLYLGGFAAPLLLESDEPAVARLRSAFSWINLAAKRLMRVSVIVSVIGLVALIAAFASQVVLSRTVLPTLLGLDVSDLTLTLQSPTWLLRMVYFVGLALDAYWTVACVFLYYDSQSRRMATDLRVRLQNLTGAAA